MTKISMATKITTVSKPAIILKRRDIKEGFSKKEKSFGPLKNQPNKLEKREVKKEKHKSTTGEKAVASFLKDEENIKNWSLKLKSGYLPSHLELLEIQGLVYKNLQKVELASKIIQSLQQTMNSLKQTQL
jgi:hypothetical protein